MKPIVKVDRVSSVEEASELQQLGVNIIGVSFDLDPRFKDVRKIQRELARSIRKCLVSAQLCCELPTIDDETLFLIESCDFDFLQVSNAKIPPLNFRRRLKQLGIGLIYSGIEASYEDDPAWIMSRFEDEKELGASYFQLDLLADIDGSWFFLKEECPRYSEELQIEDIEHIASQYPLLITLDYSCNNIIEIINQVKNIKGISFTLGAIPTHNDFHWFSHTEVIDIRLVATPI